QSRFQANRYKSIMDVPGCPSQLRWNSVAMKNLERDTKQEVRRLEARNRELAEANVALIREVEDLRLSLSRRETDWRLIVESIPVAVGVTTPIGEVETLNQATLDYFGLSLDELKGWTGLDVVHPNDLERTVADQRAAHAGGRSYNVESRHRRADGVY